MQQAPCLIGAETDTQSRLPRRTSRPRHSGVPEIRSSGIFQKMATFWAVSCPEIFQKCVLCMENPVLQTDETTAISIRPEAVQQTGMTGAMARGAALLLLLGMAAATHEYCSPGAFALNVSRTHPSTVRTRASLACPTWWRGGRGERAALRRRRARLCCTAPSVSERLRDGCGADWPAGAVVLAVCAVGAAPAPPPPAAYACPGSRDRRVSLARQTTVPNSAHSCTVVVGAVGASWGCGRGC